MEKRPAKESDQEQIEKAFNLLKSVMQENGEIEPSLWASAFWSILVDGYSSSGVSYDAFCKEWDEIKEHYKPWFEKK